MSFRSGLHLLVCLLLAGCSGFANTVGLSSLGSQLNGSYVPYPAEQAWGCPQLIANLRHESARISGVDARAKSERTTTPTTLAAVAGRTFDIQHMGLNSVKEARIAHARFVALREVARNKECNLESVPEITGASETLALFANRTN